MKVSTILDHIDSGHMALPEFQRGYVWNRDQVRGLFDSLYRRPPGFEEVPKPFHLPECRVHRDPLRRQTRLLEAGLPVASCPVRQVGLVLAQRHLRHGGQQSGPQLSHPSFSFAGVTVWVAVALGVETVGLALGVVPRGAVGSAVPIDAAVPAGVPHLGAVTEVPDGRVRGTIVLVVVLVVPLRHRLRPGRRRHSSGLFAGGGEILR